MKLIDILNKIANGELKEGTEIKIVNGSDYFTYRTNNEEDETFHKLLDKDGQNIFASYYMEVLEDEVELIEPQEPTDNTKIEELDGYEANLMNIFFKLNEVINKVNAQTTVVLAHQKEIEEIKSDLDY